MMHFSDHSKHVYAYDATGKKLHAEYHTPIQPYKYNGKELDRHHGLDWYDYGARWYNGYSWTTPDPHAESYYDTSPYMYCYGNPVKYVDPNGMDGVTDGKLVTIYPSNALPGIDTMQDDDRINKKKKKK